MNPIKKGRPLPTPNNTDLKYKRKLPYRKSPAVKFLEKMANDAARMKYPDTPPQWLAPRKYRDDSANGLTRCIIHFLTFKGHQAERINNTGRPIDQRKTFTDVIGRTQTIGSMKWIPGTGTRGTADISATIAGRSVKIEIKQSDRQSQAQKEYQQQVEVAGGIYIIVRSFEEFHEWYNQTFCYE